MDTKLSKKDLLECNEHLLYEYEMMNGSVKYACLTASSWHYGENIISNALLESFILHSRCLISFMFGERDRKDDVCAIDYINDWNKIRPEISERLKKVLNRAGKEVAHLTTKRVGLSPLEKSWEIFEIRDEINNAFDIFLANCPYKYLTGKLLQYKNALIC